MQCPNCNNPLPDSAKFCNMCGHPVDSPLPTQLAGETQQQEKGEPDGPRISGEGQMGESEPQSSPMPATQPSADGESPRVELTQSADGPRSPRSVPQQIRSPQPQGAPSPNQSQQQPKPARSAGRAGRAGGIGREKTPLTRVIAGIVIVLLLFFVGGRITSCMSSCSGNAVGNASKGGALAFNLDSKAMEDTVTGLLEAAKNKDERAIAKYYMGDVEDFKAEPATPVFVTEQTIYDGTFEKAFAMFASQNKTAKKVNGKIDQTLHSFGYEIIGVMPQGNMIGEEAQGARVRVRVDSTYIAGAEQASEKEMVNALLSNVDNKAWSAYMETLKGLVMDYDGYDWGKMIVSDTVGWINLAIDSYYTALEENLGIVRTTPENVSGAYADFVVVRDGDSWRVAQMQAASLSHIWGGYIAKFGPDDVTKSLLNPAIEEYFSDPEPADAVTVPKAVSDGGELSDVRDGKAQDEAAAKLGDGVLGKARNVRYGKDSSERWVVTGEVENTGDDGSNVFLLVLASGKDANGTEFENEGVAYDPVAGVRCDSIAHDMRRGEKRQFTLILTKLLDSDWPIVELRDLEVVAFEGIPSDYAEASDEVEVTVDNVYYDLIHSLRSASPDIVMTGKMKNKSGETVKSPFPVIVFTKDGLPVPDLDYEETGHAYGALMTDDSDNAMIPESLGPGEEAEFTIRTQSGGRSADGMFLSYVRVDAE